MLERLGCSVVRAVLCYLTTVETTVGLHLPVVGSRFHVPSTDYRLLSKGGAVHPLDKSSSRALASLRSAVVKPSVDALDVVSRCDTARLLRVGAKQTLIPPGPEAGVEVIAVLFGVLLPRRAGVFGHGWTGHLITPLCPYRRWSRYPYARYAGPNHVLACFLRCLVCRGCLRSTRLCQAGAAGQCLCALLLAALGGCWAGLPATKANRNVVDPEKFSIDGIVGSVG